MKGYRVLVVDDAEDVHLVVGSYLELSGYEVLHARDGERALVRMAERAPDLVLLDIQMPVMDGFGVLEEMRSSSTLEDVPVLVLSSLDRPELKVRALQVGADDYIVKPFDRSELMARVARALRRSERYQRLAGTLSGDFSGIGFAELLQTLDISRKRARVRLHDLDAELVVRDARLVLARWGQHQGHEAFQRLLLLERGRFEVEFDPPEAAGESPVGQLRNLLFDTVVCLDEVARQLSPLESMDSRLEVSPSAAMSEIPEQILGRLPGSAAEILAAMDGDLKANASLLAAALASQSVRVAPPTG